jgi:flagellar hook-length control protein FliK
VFVEAGPALGLPPVQKGDEAVAVLTGGADFLVLMQAATEAVPVAPPPEEAPAARSGDESAVTPDPWAGEASAAAMPTEAAPTGSVVQAPLPAVREPGKDAAGPVAKGKGPGEFPGVPELAFVRARVDMQAIGGAGPTARQVPGAGPSGRPPGWAEPVAPGRDVMKHATPARPVADVLPGSPRGYDTSFEGSTPAGRAGAEVADTARAMIRPAAGGPPADVVPAPQARVPAEVGSPGWRTAPPVPPVAPGGPRQPQSDVAGPAESEADPRSRGPEPSGRVGDGMRADGAGGRDIPPAAGRPGAGPPAGPLAGWTIDMRPGLGPDAAPRGRVAAAVPEAERQVPGGPALAAPGRTEVVLPPPDMASPPGAQAFVPTAESDQAKRHEREVRSDARARAPEPSAQTLYGAPATSPAVAAQPAPSATRDRAPAVAAGADAQRVTELEDALPTLHPADASAGRKVWEPAFAPPPTASADPRAVANQLVAAVRDGGEGRIEIQLSPEELGRVTVSVQVRDDAVVLAIHADRQDTLDLMRRHADVLQREFREAGFTTMSFSFGQGSADSRQTRDTARAAPVDEPIPAGAPVRETSASRGGATSTSRLDLRL